MSHEGAVLALAISGDKVAKMGLWTFFDVCAREGGVRFLLPATNPGDSPRVVQRISREEFEGREKDIVFPQRPGSGIVGRCDVVLSKLTNALVSSTPSVREDARAFAAEIESASSVCHLDILAGQEATLDRETLGTHLVAMDADFSKTHSNLHNPRHVTFDSPVGPGEKYDIGDLEFPVICKTRQAGGAASAHKMGIAFSEEGMHDFEPPFIAQEYFNHDNAVFKVFVLGDFVHTVTRPSVPNLPESVKQTLFFDSQHPLEDQIRPFLGDEVVQNSTPVEPSQDLVRDIVTALSKEFSLSLFGFDLIRSTKTGKFGIIDLNYFPGYIGVPEFEERLYALVANSKVEGS
jgi:inositol-1,3,4-trisphosphate 5/6-kinase / inositol-tetrakisphosphate 1-kinase